jgi:metal-responsive CopG/Arc/MetJ family transcriptional regulator
MKKQVLLYIGEDVIDTLDKITKKEGISRSRVVEGMVDMMLGNFGYEDISKHINNMTFADGRKNRTSHQ